MVLSRAKACTRRANAIAPYRPPSTGTRVDSPARNPFMTLGHGQCATEHCKRTIPNLLKLEPCKYVRLYAVSAIDQQSFTCRGGAPAALVQMKIQVQCEAGE